MLQPGTYVARAVEGKLGYAKTGTERVAVRFEIVEPAEAAGQSIIWDGWLTDNAFERTVESLRHAGMTGDDLVALEGLGSKNVELVIAEEEYQGEFRAKVKWVNKLGGGRGLTVGAMPEDKAKEFAARMRARVAGIGGQRPGAGPRPTPQRRDTVPAPPPSAAAKPPVREDDIPF